VDFGTQTLAPNYTMRVKFHDFTDRKLSFIQGGSDDNSRRLLYKRRQVSTNKSVDNVVIVLVTGAQILSPINQT